LPPPMWVVGRVACASLLTAAADWVPVAEEDGL
jgi:hypothetical protein